MGFFSNIFKKKKGGTLFGNLLRGAASTATGGILGSGAGLAKWEAEQEQIEYDKAYKATQERLQQNAAYNAGRSTGNMINLSSDPNDPAVKQTEKNATKLFFKKFGAWIALAAVAVIGGTIFLTKKFR